MSDSLLHKGSKLYSLAESCRNLAAAVKTQTQTSTRTANKLHKRGLKGYLRRRLQIGGGDPMWLPTSRLFSSWQYAAVQAGVRAEARDPAALEHASYADDGVRTCGLRHIPGTYP